MTKKVFTIFLLMLVFMVFSTFTLATNEIGEGVNNISNTVMDGTENLVNGAGNALENEGNMLQHEAGTVMDTVDDAINTEENMINNVVEPRTYDATDSYDTSRSSAVVDNSGTILSNNIVTWVVIATLAIIIIALVWYYARQDVRSRK